MSQINPALLFQGEGHHHVNAKLNRDTQILQGALTHADRQAIAKAWSRVAKLGLLGHMAIKARRDARRGWAS
jgi:hypothetical protein